MAGGRTSFDGERKYYLSNLPAYTAIKDVADRHAQGRIVSVLEGGYVLSALARSVVAHLRVLADV